MWADCQQHVRVIANVNRAGDGIPNGWKQQYGLDPFDLNLGSKDPDGDGLNNAQEYQAASPGEDEELRSPYVADDTLDLSAWARDALALGLPDKILHAPDCAGLCPVCGKDLNEEPHTHEEAAADPRWAALDELRGRL